MRKVVKKVGGIVLSGALALNVLGSMPMQEARADGGSTIEVKSIGDMKEKLSSAVGEFLNASALNKKEGESWKISDATESSKVAKVYFGGNEYFIVNADKDNKIDGQRVVTLAARKGYANKAFKSDAGWSMSDVVYKDSDIEKYLTGEGADGFLQEFGAGRKLEWNSVVAKKICTGVPYASQKDNKFVNSENYPNKDKTTEANDGGKESGVYVSSPKFYLMGGSYNKTETGQDNNNYAYAGQNEVGEAGYAVRCSLFGGGYSWLRSA